MLDRGMGSTTCWSSSHCQEKYQLCSPGSLTGCSMDSRASDKCSSGYWDIEWALSNLSYNCSRHREQCCTLDSLEFVLCLSKPWAPSPPHQPLWMMDTDRQKYHRAWPLVLSVNKINFIRWVNAITVIYHTSKAWLLASSHTCGTNAVRAPRAFQSKRRLTLPKFASVWKRARWRE